MRTTPFLAATLLLGPSLTASAARAAADDTAPAAPVTAVAPAAPPANGALPPTPPIPPVSIILPVSEPAWLNTHVDIHAHNATVLEALKQVLDEAKAGDTEIENNPPPKNVPETSVTAGFLVRTERRLTLEMKDVAVRDALAAIARLAEANSYVSSVKTNDKKLKTVLELRPRGEGRSVSAPMIVTSGQDYSQFGRDIQEQVRAALAQARAAAHQASQAQAFTYPFHVHGPLSVRRVSLDKQDVDVRDALKDILKQAGVDYALDPDVPSDMKKSFTFENAPLETALDSICDAAGIGWIAEPEPFGKPASNANKKDQTGTNENALVDKVVVRIGKRFAGRGDGAFRSGHGATFDFDADSARRLSADAVSLAKAAADNWCLTPALGTALSIISDASGDEEAL